ncbi:hypothetical protein FA15DRAFT_708053 [Coprinopsis marcescibilis]|uniref:Uncharacterized protein n=1 Tax=Coprinopsis marcescibilis TaxID=230819 RepID=A0A5C3KKN3_COPMA|nr:hypothetical protein FA15DRAFT_708053 [Coprinopsis marcescibilis]
MNTNSEYVCKDCSVSYAMPRYLEQHQRDVCARSKRSLSTILDQAKEIGECLRLEPDSETHRQSHCTPGPRYNSQQTRYHRIVLTTSEAGPSRSTPSPSQHTLTQPEVLDDSSQPVATRKAKRSCKTPAQFRDNAMDDMKSSDKESESEDETNSNPERLPLVTSLRRTTDLGYSMAVESEHRPDFDLSPPSPADPTQLEDSDPNDGLSGLDNS